MEVRKQGSSCQVAAKHAAALSSKEAMSRLNLLFFGRPTM
jgi:hypothetical protein